MALEVIGSGFGRTGTRSLKDALEILGFGPCHHMDEVFARPEQVPIWQVLARGQEVDLSAAYRGFRSQVDWPGAHVWRQAARQFPGAKVLHSVRPEESWWRSYSGTIGKLMSIYGGLELPPHVRAMLTAADRFIVQATMGGNPLDREACLAAFRAREAEVRATIAPERLLVFDVAQGWAPLCAFLGVAVPDQPFPRRNDKAEFWEDLGGDPA